ncbi:hypothetical protein [Streptomyces sp. NPDC058622]|uniref:hypothetical protein n=1 Tax=Streptomyces sp. NPDC058622 TaxID=3346562 RepID=UPI00364C06B3
MVGAAGVGAAITAWGITPAVAAPGSLSQLVALTESTQPVLTAKTAAGTGGQVTGKSYAGTYAAGGADDLVDGAAVTVNAGRHAAEVRRR